MPKINLEFTRTRVEVGNIEVEVTEEAAEALSDPRNLDAWAQFTMAYQVKNWTSAHLATPRSQKFTATLDGVPMKTDWRTT